MARWNCIEKCWWKNQFWSPFPDGKQVYEGGEEPPKSKGGKPYFVRADAPPVVAAPPPVTDKQAEGAFVKDYMLKRMTKHDLLNILEKRYKTPIKDEEITREKLIEMVREKQATDQTNQDVANTVKE
jgi:hypothetical protein